LQNYGSLSSQLQEREAGDAVVVHLPGRIR